MKIAKADGDPVVIHRLADVLGISTLEDEADRRNAPPVAVCGLTDDAAIVAAAQVGEQSFGQGVLLDGLPSNAATINSRGEPVAPDFSPSSQR
jgi:hypothetical protein